METAASPLYKRLDPSTSEIRLLEVPEDGSEDWGLVTVSLNKDPKYFALSYVWGEKKDLKKIVLRGQDIEITPNLASALSRIRSGSLGETPTPVKYLWVDAICIDQEDNEERSQQVRFMHRIFKCAQVVFSWVGPNDHSLAFQTIKTLSHEVARNYSNNPIPDDHDEIGAAMILGMPPFELEWLQRHPSLCNETPGAKGEFNNDAWNATRALLLEEYWKRVWIYQEAVLARRLHLFSSGGTTLSRQDLLLFARSYQKLGLKSKVDKGEVKRPEFLCHGVWSGFINSLPHVGINTICSAMFATRLSEITSTARPDWDETVTAARLVATDPRDYIYGLLAISQIPMTPDYSKSVTEVYTEFVERWMEASKEARDKPIPPLVQDLGQARDTRPHPLAWVSIPPLGFLSLAGVGLFGPSTSFPSWAPNFPKNALQYPQNLLQLPILRHLFREDPSKYPHLDRDTGSLVVWGAEIEPVIHVSRFPKPDQLNKENLREQIFRIGSFFRHYMSRHTHYATGITSWQVITRLLFKENSPTVTRAMVLSLLGLAAATSRYGKEFHPEDLGGWDSPDSFIFPNGWETELYKRAFPNTDLTQLGFSKSPLADKELQKKEAQEYLTLMRGNMRNRSIFETEGGYLGRGHLHVQEGDVLCVLKDYDKHVLLRKQGGYYTFVGEASVVDLELEKSIQDSPSGLEWLKLQ